MEMRTYHGEISPHDFARSLIAEFNRGNLQAQQLGNDEKIVVQIVTRDMPVSGGQTAMTIQLQKAADGVTVQIGKQAWLGVAASLGMTALGAWRNPWSLLTRLDDLAQDLENLQLSEQVWRTIEDTARSLGASFELSERLRKLVCVYCDTPNPLGESSCIACGAPLGVSQPKTCQNCGFITKSGESRCPNCGKPL